MKRCASIAVLCGWLLVSMTTAQAKSVPLQDGQLQTEPLPTRVAYAPKTISALTPQTTSGAGDYWGKQSRIYRWSDQWEPAVKGGSAFPAGSTSSKD